MKNFMIIAMMLTLSLFLMACDVDNNIIPNNNNNGVDSFSNTATVSEQLKAQGELEQFNSYDELESYLERNQDGGGSYYGMGMLSSRSAMMFDSMDVASEGLSMNSASLKVSPPSNTQSSNDYSETNVQVEGVDESDIVKTDGKYIYTLTRSFSDSQSVLTIVDVDSFEKVSTITFKNYQDGMYLNDDKLIVYGYNYNRNDELTFIPPYWSSQSTKINVLDISDRDNPEVERTILIEGSIVDSRMVGSTLYMVTSKYMPSFVDVDYSLPRIVDGDSVLEKVLIGDISYVPYQSSQFTMVSAIDVANKNKKIEREVILGPYSSNIYSSKDNLYVTFTKYVDEYTIMMEVMNEIMFPKLPSKLQDRIELIQKTSSSVLSDSEKSQKISYIVQSYVSQLSNDEQKEINDLIESKLEEKYESLADELEKTIIHKISIDKTSINYDSTGEVPGRIQNQFFMDEDGDYFRIATTTSSRWSRLNSGRTESSNNLFVLDKNLKVVGDIRNIAPGETIYSVRFMQDRAYMVTYKRIDPFFVIDLSNPKNPTILGQLKIPGYSTYLHPYDENHIIGLGQQTSDNDGRTTTGGLKLSLFDVTDVENPIEQDVIELGDRWSSSEALYDHKAFLFDKEKELIAIPVTLRTMTEGSYYSKVTFQGAAVFKITEDEIVHRGNIGHNDGEFDDNYRYSRNYETMVHRIIYIGDNLYTISNKYIKANKISTLEGVDTVLIEIPDVAIN